MCYNAEMHETKTKIQLSGTIWGLQRKKQYIELKPGDKGTTWGLWEEVCSFPTVCSSSPTLSPASCVDVVMLMTDTESTFLAMCRSKRHHSISGERLRV